MGTIKQLKKALSKTAIFCIRLYQVALSPLIPTRCRYTPTCSNYTIAAIEEWGLIRGVWLGIRRISRCHPCGGWGADPVPKKSIPKTETTKPH